MKHALSILILLLASVAQAQTIVQGPDWIGRQVQVRGTAIGWQDRLEGGCLMVQLQDPLPGRVWACNTTLRGGQTTAWILEGKQVEVGGRISTVQRTKMGPGWRWLPRIENARVR